MKIIAIIPFLGICHLSFAKLDMNGNGISEIWELANPQVIDLKGDDDLDGLSNYEEAVAGTDPADPHDFLKLELVFGGADQVVASWQTVGGKSYRIEKFVEGQWVGIASFLPRSFSYQKKVPFTYESQDVFRVVAEDLDLDGDGLSAWEEAQLGWSDSDRSSSGDLNRLDYPAAVRQLENPAGSTLADSQSLTRLLPAPAEASRFLMQASFGPTSETIEGLVDSGYAKWLDDQMSLKTTRSATTMWRNGSGYNAKLWKDSWFKLATDSPDQLRQRMAYALSQIFVVGFQAGNWLGDNPLAHAVYYDHFIEHAFSDYRSILEDVTYSPAMGMYLSSLRNRKSDLAGNRFPDENFAREIMQLFSIGLWELNPDGSRKTDTDGNDLASYNNDDITQMAKVFTGLSFSKNGINNDPITFFSGVRGNAFLHPMKVYEGEHEPGPKFLLSGVVLNDTVNGGAMMTGEEEVQATLDMLSSHSNTAPFIARLLIQRLTHSNPSADYLRRVVDSWMISGSPDRRLGRVIEAILLDPEIRSGPDSDSGKVREPIIQLAHLLRALDFDNGSKQFLFNSDLLNEDFGQHPMLSPTVFNFYLSAFSPQGELADQNLVSPELQIADVVQLVTADNRFRSFIDQGWGNRVIADYQRLLAFEGSTSALLNHLELLFSSRPLKLETRESITTAVDRQTSPLERVKTAVHLVITSPEATILK